MTAAAPPRGAAPHRGDGQRKAVLFKQFAPHLGSIFFPGRHNTSALAGRKEGTPHACEERSRRSSSAQKVPERGQGFPWWPQPSVSYRP